MAAWTRLSLTMLFQLALVPIFLSFWGRDTYGVWLALQAFTPVITLLDVAHHDYVGNDMMRVGGRNRLDLVANIMFSAIPFALALALLGFGLTLAFVSLGGVHWLIGPVPIGHEGIYRQTAIVMLIQSAAWVLTGTVSGIVFRTLYAIGWFARMEWWGVFTNSCIAFGPAVAVVFGANLLQAGIALGLISVTCQLLQMADMQRLLRREGFHMTRPDLKLGIRNIGMANILALKSLIDLMRLHGIRLLLVSMVGLAELTSFSTMRTASNVALQGLRTVVNPLLPELMDSLFERKQTRVDLLLGLVWVVLVLALVPGVILLQYLMPKFFVIWTRGKVPFDPLLFALLSYSVIVFALAQPATAIAIGNNMLKQQVTQAVLAGTALFVSLFLLVPKFGLIGVGIALIITEFVNLVGYVAGSIAWMKARGMRWPWRYFSIGIGSSVMGGLSLVTMALKGQWGGYILATSLVMTVFLLWIYWISLPKSATARFMKFIALRGGQ